MKTKLIISWFLMLLSVLYISGCGAKKKQIETYKSASEVELIQNVTEEKKVVETKISEEKIDSKKETETIFSDANFNLIADELIITNKDGSVSKFTNPKINKSSSNFNQKTKDESNAVNKDSLAKTEENKVNSESKLKTNDETESLKKTVENDQFNWGKLVLQLCVAGLVIYGLWLVYMKLKKRVL